ncbi:hypothetical protein H0I61_11330 [Yersinia kristensenii]|nr:hypothetical protein [Yersinia kristensenii]MBW5829862.1 hypothetical protein [Yersinia kristensenii]
MLIPQISFIQPRNVQRVSPAESAKKLREKSSRLRRVRDIKSAGRLDQKRPRVFRIRSVQTAGRNQQNFARHLHGQFLRAISDWHGYCNQLPAPEALDDVNLFVIQSVYHSSYLYPKEVFQALNGYFDKVAVTSDYLLEVDAMLIKKLMTKDNIITELMALLDICRSHEQHKVKLKPRRYGE